MKKRFKFLVSILLAVLLLSITATAFAQNNGDKDDIKELINNITIIENELKKDNTSVLKELNKQKAEYEQMLLNSNSAAEKNKIQALINQTQLMIEQYQMYRSGISFYGVYNPVYSAAVSSVFVYFSSKGYKLSAELLNHATINSDTNSSYEPINGSRVKLSPVYTSIANNGQPSGSGEFPNQGSTEQRDLFYAIHAFNYIKTECNTHVIIYDTYDYAWGADDAGNFVGQVAVNTMYLAQLAGVIVPYEVVIQ